LSEIFKSELDAQNQLVKNWAVWDDLYDYVKSKKKSFYESNMGQQNIADLSAQFIIIFDKDGTVVASSMKSSESRSDLQKLLATPSLNQKNIFEMSKNINIKIVLEKIDENRYAEIILHGISKSNRTGEPRGVIVFVRWLDGSFYDNVSKLFGASVKKVDLNVLPKTVELSNGVKSDWIDVDSETKDIYVYVNASSPFALEYQFRRDFYIYGMDIVKKFAIASTVFIFLTSLILFVLVRKVILSRLILLSNQLGNIGQVITGTYLKTDKSQNDEIEHIVISANSMLERMYGYQDALAKRSEELEIEVQEKISELRQKDAALVRQSRYVTIGETISNISHQWRQPLNDLWLLIQSLSSKYRAGKLEPERFDDFMAESKKLITHMSDTIEDFQTFSRPDKEKVAFFVNDMVNMAISIASSSLNNNGIVLNKTEDGRYIAFGTPNEFAQAILNIINNARDAFSSKDVKEKIISVDIANIAGMIAITIDDTAGGIDESVIETIFEPYVTTKYGKGGTGIGLFITKQIIEQCDGGNIEAKNHDKGARFIIILKEVEY
jgi:signal transduction histidine kinase